MPITREKKEQIVSKLKDEFKDSVVSVLTDYSGLTVEDISVLRRELREKGVEFKVAKNTLFLIALKDAGVQVEKEVFSKPIAIAFGKGDEVDAPKVINDFSKKNENLEILGGIIEGKYVPQETILSLANLPGREELYAKIVGSLASPLRGLACVLQGNLRGLVCVLNQYKEKIS